MMFSFYEILTFLRHMKAHLFSFFKSKAAVWTVLAVVFVGVGIFFQGDFGGQSAGPGAHEMTLPRILGAKVASGAGSSSELCGFAWSGTNESPLPKMGAGWTSFIDVPARPTANKMT